MARGWKGGKAAIMTLVRQANDDDRRMIYRYAYILVVYGGGEKEPLPDAHEMMTRIGDILSDATEREMLLIHKFARTWIAAHGGIT